MRNSTQSSPSCKPGTHISIGPFSPESIRQLIFQTINSVRINNLSLKNQKFTPSDCTEIEIIKFEFVTKTLFLLSNILFIKVKLTGLLTNKVVPAFLF